MLGVIIECSGEDGSEDNSIFERFFGRTILERVTTQALKSELAQSVIVSSPLSMRVRITGVGFMMPGLRPDLEFLRRRPQVIYGGPKDSMLDRIYYAALKGKLDKILVITGDSPLIEPWLINHYANIMQGSSGSVFSEGYDKGFDVYGFDFHALANTFIYAEDRDTLQGMRRYVEDNFKHKIVTNYQEDGSSITCANKDLRFTLASQKKEYSYILEELDKGAEINDLIKDIVSDKQEED